MSDPWQRPYFAPGGGDAYVHYVVFGASPSELRVSKSKHRYGGSAAVGVSALRRGEASFFAPDEPAWQGILEGSGVDPDKVRGADVQAVVGGSVKDPASLHYLRDAIGLVTALLETGGCAVLDLQTLTFFDPTAWNEKVFAPDRPEISAHISVLVSDSTGESAGTEARPTARPTSRWLHTRGMRKFGRPDFSIDGVEQTWLDAAVEVIERFAGYAIGGGQVDPRREVKVEGFPSGYFATLSGSLDDPEFNNVHFKIEQTWDPAP